MLDDRPPHFMFYVYLLKSRSDGKLYIGYTGDLRRRLAEHNSGQSPATRSRGQFVLVYYEAYRCKADALKRERMLKQFKQGYTLLKKRLADSLKT
jgi:putative endonuclease